jgi:hypothetical protein
MKYSNMLNRALLGLAVVLGAFFLLRGSWVGIEGLSGKLPLDQQDWRGVVLFLLSGILLAIFVIKRLRHKPI